MLSVFNGAAQSDEKPVLERHSVSTSQKNTDEPTPEAELKKNSITITKNKNASDSLQQLNASQLKRSDYSDIRKEQPKNSK